MADQEITTGDVSDETSTGTDSVSSDTGTEDNVSAESSGESDADAQAAALLASENTESSEAGEKPGYKPNLKYKVLDKEMEIPKEFESLMKDQESEKKIRELFEKAEGLPTVKQKLETVRGENQNLSKEVGYHRDVVSNLQSIYQKAMTTGNLHKLDDWFSVFNIPQDVIIKYALEKVKLAELPPEQRQMLVGQMDAERNVELQQRQNAELQQNYARLNAEAKTSQLEMQMLNPEFKTAAEAFDSRVGRSGAFKDEVRKTGQLAWHTEKVDLTPEQAIKRVIENYGLKSQAAPAATQAAPAGGSGQTTTVVAKKPASTIPNISGGSKSPVSTSKVKTLDDLKKLRDQAWSQSS